MWNTGWRNRIWQAINQPWDVIVIGGGITGAGVLRLATGCGLQTLLLEANDFSFGTSSRSSKLVHGGLRYLFNKQFDVTQESVTERQWMLHVAPHLVNSLAFVLPNYAVYRFPTFALEMGIKMYDLMGKTNTNYRISAKKVIASHPNLCQDKIFAGFRYYDANVDDCRLVLRVIREAVTAGGTALNYARVERLLCDSSGKVCGVAVQENIPSGRSAEVLAKVVVNATGPWSDDLRLQLGVEKRLRKLQGSHLVFPQSRFPLMEALTLFHPRDGRALFILPWEGTTVVGTTDIDHEPDLENQSLEPFASQAELEYLMEAVTFLLPGLELLPSDVLSTFSGLRPVIGGGADTPSKESRRHAVWQEQGLITITGGKLTIFRTMARQTMDVVLSVLGREPDEARHVEVFNPLPTMQIPALQLGTLNYLLGRYGDECASLLNIAQPGELEPIENLPNLWVELRWAARFEGVQHLDDLLLRRVRLGLLLPQGAREYLPRIRSIVQPELGWSDELWLQEENNYIKIWEQAYSPQPHN